MSDPIWLLSMDDDLWDYREVDVPEFVIEEWLEFPLKKTMAYPPFKDNCIVEESEENKRKWNWFGEVDSRLRGGDKHSKYMCALQAFLYDGIVKPDVVEVWNHDLVDKEDRIMGEVGYNGQFDHRPRSFVKRVFRFLKSYSDQLDSPQEWEFWYLNYNRELYKVNPSKKAYSILVKSLSEKADEHRQYQNNVDI